MSVPLKEIKEILSRGSWSVGYSKGDRRRTTGPEGWSPREWCDVTRPGKGTDGGSDLALKELPVTEKCQSWMCHGPYTIHTFSNGVLVVFLLMHEGIFLLFTPD